MASIKEIRNHIASIKDTQKITGAMISELRQPK